MKNQRSAFTLIELLVVVAIIALLISILLPGLNASQQLARQVYCMSNVRQLSVAVSVYAASHNRAIPRYTDDWNSYPAIGTLIDAGLLPVNSIDTASGFTVSKSLMCPARSPTALEAIDASDAGYVEQKFRNGFVGMIAQTPGADLRQLWNPAPYRKVYTHYLVNGKHPAWVNGFRFPFSNYDQPQSRLETIRSGSGTFMLGDAWASDFGLCENVFPHPRLSCNFAFFDSHAESLRPAELDASNSGVWRPLILLDDDRLGRLPN